MSEELLTIDFRNLSNRMIERHPVTYGVPLGRGVLREAAGVAVRLPSGEHRPTQAKALERYLDNPEMCPHGHPIPNADGTIAETSGVSLAGLEAGCSAPVLRVAEDDDAVLSYLCSLGLFPGAEVQIIEAAPFEGPLLVEIEGHRSALARDMAARIIVEPGEGCSV